MNAMSLWTRSSVNDKAQGLNDMVLASSEISTKANIPETSVIVLNHNGKQHLGPCLTSLLELDYPKDRLEIILVDNGSSDGSVAWVAERFPDVKIVALDDNLGFCAGNNRGAEAAQGEYIAFLNNDTRVHSQWLKELVRLPMQQPEIVSTAARILDWEGKVIDFAGATMNFHGFAFQRHFGFPAQDARMYEQEEPILFACGGSMLIKRDIFLAVGGFDEDYFIYFEDADLGWRLWLMGYQVWFVPSAVSYHRLHATMDAFHDFRKTVLYERNALSTIIKNYEKENLQKVLPAALFLAIKRSIRYLDMAGWDRGSYYIKGPPAARVFERLPRSAISVLVALDEVLENMPRLIEKRAFVQACRKRPDEEIFHLFGQPMRVHTTHHNADESYARSHYVALSCFEIDDLFSKDPKRVLVVASDLLPLPGQPTTGAGLRAWSLGEGLRSQGHEVIYSMPRAAARGREDLIPVEVLVNVWDQGRLDQVVERVAPDVVVACGWSVLSNLRRATCPIVVDQHGPHLLERQMQGHLDFEHNEAEKLSGLAKADFFTCPGRKQWEYFLPWLRKAGWEDPEGRSAIVPVSLAPLLPEHRPTYGEVVFVYGGVFLPWQDPSLGLRTLAEVLAERQQGHLEIFGGPHPFIPMSTGIFDRLREELSKNPRVEFHPLIPREQLLEIYQQAHVAIDLMKRNPERELAFTTRTVEYLWCGLPVIYNDYSELSRYISEYNAGWIVDPENKEEIAKVIDEILSSPEMLSEYSQNAQRLVRERLTWDKTIEPLDRFCRNPVIRQRPQHFFSPEPMEGAKPSGKTLEMLIDEARFHYRQGGIKRLLKETAGFIRRRMSRGP